jgi:hypothetical protein
MGDQMTAELAVEAANMAVWSWRPQGEVIHQARQGGFR